MRPSPCRMNVPKARKIIAIMEFPLHSNSRLVSGHLSVCIGQESEVVTDASTSQEWIYTDIHSWEVALWTRVLDGIGVMFGI